MAKCCIICGGDEADEELLLETPCGRHWVCPDDVGSFFERATSNESLFPPKCCGQMFMLEDYEDYVPFDIAWAYQVKEQGEYAVLARFRVYCANPPCARFLDPSVHVQDPGSKITYAICEGDGCGKLTCVKCKMLLDQIVENHVCQQDENEKKFKQTATEKGYQECSVCGAVVELAEACNHITCECGHDFCYVCGKDWPGVHGCPHYGRATYDEEGYNQDGYHRDTGLNRDGLTRRQQNARDRAGGGDADDEDEEDFDEEDEGGRDPEWEVMQHLTPEQRGFINNLPDRAREDALDQFRIELFETQGITFHQGQGPPLPIANPGLEGDEDDEQQDEEEEPEERGDWDDDEQDHEHDDEDGTDLLWDIVGDIPDSLDDEPNHPAIDHPADDQSDDDDDTHPATEPHTYPPVDPIPQGRAMELLYVEWLRTHSTPYSAEDASDTDSLYEDPNHPADPGLDAYRIHHTAIRRRALDTATEEILAEIDAAVYGDPDLPSPWTPAPVFSGFNNFGTARRAADHEQDSAAESRDIDDGGDPTSPMDIDSHPAEDDHDDELL